MTTGRMTTGSDRRKRHGNYSQEVKAHKPGTAHRSPQPKLLPLNDYSGEQRETASGEQDLPELGVGHDHEPALALALAGY